MAPASAPRRRSGIWRRLGRWLRRRELRGVGSDAGSGAGAPAPGGGSVDLPTSASEGLRSRPPAAVALRSRARRWTGAAVDRALLRVMMRPERYPGPDDYVRVKAELEAARALYARKGVLGQPGLHHRDPGHGLQPERSTHRQHGLKYEHLRFASDYPLDRQDPAHARWASYHRNRVAHAWVLRHPGPPRPWLVCVHGLGTGSPFLDFPGFRASVLHRELGLNLIFPVLPLHGPRRERHMGLGALISYELLDTFHGLGQAAWDMRRLVRWVRAEGATSVGAFGLSMGAYAAGLLAGLEELDLLIAGIPLSDVPGLFVHHAGPELQREVRESGLLGAATDELFQLVSPRTLAPRVPLRRRYIFAASDDQVTTPAQAEDLWKAWQRPNMRWFDGGHVSFFWTRAVGQFVDRSLGDAGFKGT